MAITEQTTPEFRDDLNRLNTEDRARVAEALHRSYHLLRNNRGSFFARAKRPQTIHLKGGFSSSLYSLDKASGWRLHLQYEDGQIHLKDIIEGQKHDDALGRIQAKKIRYQSKQRGS